MARSYLTAAAALAGLALTSLAPVDAMAATAIVGSTSATLGWAPASGPVAAYDVYVSVNGAPYPAAPSARVTGTRAILGAAWGNWLRTRVVAIDKAGASGPASPQSDILLFARDASDLDGDGVPNPLDRCPRMPDPDQTDRDADGRGDACDPCTRLSWSFPPLATPDQDPRASVLNLLSLQGRNGPSVLFRGFFRPDAGAPALAPPANGVHVEIGDVYGTVADFELPPQNGAWNACDPRAGWRATRLGWSFRTPRLEPGAGGCVAIRGRPRFSARIEDRGEAGILFVFNGSQVGLRRAPALPLLDIHGTFSPAVRSDVDEATWIARLGGCAEARYATTTSTAPSPLPVCRAVYSKTGLSAVRCQSR